MHKSWERPFIKSFHGFLDSTIALPGVLFENGKVHGVYEIGKDDWTEIILLVAGQRGLDRNNFIGCGSTV